MRRLTVCLKERAGRANSGRITQAHIGGGHKRLYRIIDFKRNKKNIPAKVIAIEYDPNRTSRIALLQYRDGEKRYIIAPVGLSVGDEVIAGENVDIKPANALPLKSIPIGTIVHNVELFPGKGGQLGRSAGSTVQVMAKEDDFAQLRLSSGEIRLVPLKSYASVGQVGNIEHENVSLGKAGKSRWRGIRPKVRGVAMNPCDHPHGGGEGKGKGGNHPRSGAGVLAKGFKTRKQKQNDWMIIQRRK